MERGEGLRMMHGRQGVRLDRAAVVGLLGLGAIALGFWLGGPGAPAAGDRSGPPPAARTALQQPEAGPGGSGRAEQPGGEVGAEEPAPSGRLFETRYVRVRFRTREAASASSRPAPAPQPAEGHVPPGASM
ncbi:MAG: hypothetical protein KatS3mg102_2823 [Planctomycetota bacterium]|nr:MAG: hypothetical protein KatS3mg102_2823 [Planctomycetota bacterium]